MNKKAQESKQLTTLNTNHTAVTNITTGNYVSMAGNVYNSNLFSSDGISIKELTGQGYWFKFLNGIKVFSNPNNVLIGERFFHNLEYSTRVAKSYAVEILCDQVRKAAELQNLIVNEEELTEKARVAVENAFTKKN